MILEVAILPVRRGQSAAFEAAFGKAQALISSIPGYLSHELQRGVENDHEYVLLVRWQKLEHHTIGFRQSPQYQQWRELLHHFYDQVPDVSHYSRVFSGQVLPAL
jgi:heme-degrading monooxygenase HmoA